jgi:phage gpG-like protein
MPGRYSHATIEGDRRVKQLLSEMADRTRGVYHVWPKVGDVIAGALDKQFESEGAYFYARKWKPLQPDYLAWKIRNGYDPRRLHQTGAMRRSLTSRPMSLENYFGNRAVFGTRDRKAAFHQNGTRFMPKRQIIRVTEDLADDVSSVIAKWIFENRLEAP